MREDTIQSEVVKGRNRRYFFDVSDTETGLLLTIKESRITNGKQVAQVIHIWEPEVTAFFVGFLKCLGLFASEDLRTALQALRDPELGK